LEGRARERYDALDRLNAELSWYREQYNALDALVEALRTTDEWLVYQAEVLWDSSQSWTPKLWRTSPWSRG
jgi:hypothetical protein